ncbi:unnamed protein product [Choristocarpus tenellus]
MPLCSPIYKHSMGKYCLLIGIVGLLVQVSKETYDLGRKKEVTLRNMRGKSRGGRDRSCY